MSPTPPTCSAKSRALAASPDRTALLLRLAVVLVVYYAASRLGMSMAALTENVAAVWPAAGVGLGLVRLLGLGVLPAIFVGEYLSGLHVTPALPELFIALGNTLSLYLAERLLQAYGDARDNGNIHNNPRTSVLFTLAACPLLGFVSATIGTVSLLLAGLLQGGAFSLAWWTWFLGDYTGALVVTPLFIVFAREKSWSVHGPRPKETLGLMLAILLAGWLVFGHLPSMTLSDYPLAFVFTPLLTWAAFRLGHRETMLAMFLMAAVAMVGTVAGLGPFSQSPFPENLLLLQVYLVIICATTLIMHGVVVQRELAMQHLELTQDVTIHSLASLAETRDSETGGHLRRTQNYVRILAETLSDLPPYCDMLDERTINLLFKSAPLHDIGKVGVPDSILLKPGKLTPEEFEEIKKHPLYGVEALGSAVERLGENSFVGLAREVIAYHHERWDGTGYPYGLRGEEIPIPGRLMALADVYDALISRRVYKPAFSHNTAREIILEGAGSHFAPEVVQAFLHKEHVFREIAEQFADESNQAENPKD